MKPRHSVTLALLVGLSLTCLGPMAQAQTYRFQTFAKGLAESAPATPGTPEEPGTSFGPVSTSSASVVFDATQVGLEPAARTVQVLNTGSKPARIESIHSDHAEFIGEHDCPVSPATLAAGSSCTISVRYLAQSAASLVQTLSIVSSANTVAVSLHGQAGESSLRFQNPAFDGGFGEVDLHTTASARRAHLVNVGVAAVTVERVEIVGSDAFAITSNTCNNVTLQGGGGFQSECDVFVSATPALAELHSASLQVVVGGNVVRSEPLTVEGRVAFVVDSITPLAVESIDENHELVVSGSALADSELVIDTLGSTQRHALAANHDESSATVTLPTLAWGRHLVTVERPGRTPSIAREMVSNVTFEPVEGAAIGGETLTFTGRGFDANTRIFLGDQQAAVQSWNETSLTALSPGGVPGQSLAVRVQHGTTTTIRDLELSQTFAIVESSAEGEVRTLNASFFSGNHSLAYNPTTGQFLYSSVGQVWAKPAVGGSNEFITTGAGENIPNSILVHPSGTVYTLDFSGNVRYKRPGESAVAVPPLPEAGGQRCVFDLSPSHDIVAVCVFNTVNITVIPTDNATGVPLNDQRKVIQAPRDYFNPRYISAGPDGVVWLAANTASQTTRFVIDTGTSALLSQTNYNLSAAGAIRGMHADGHGNLYIAYPNHVQKFNTATSEITNVVGLAGSASRVDGVGEDGRFQSIDVMVESNGRLLVRDGGTALREIIIN